MSPKLIEKPSCFSKDDLDLDDLDREALRRAKELEDHPEMALSEKELDEYIKTRLSGLDRLDD